MPGTYRKFTCIYRETPRRQPGSIQVFRVWVEVAVKTPPAGQRPMSEVWRSQQDRVAFKCKKRGAIVMPPKCTICIHPEREQIDRDLLAGVSLRNIAERCSVSTTALHRHKNGGHIARALTQAREVEEVARADTLLDQVHALLDKARSLTDQAEVAGDLRTALAGIREVRGVLELMAKVTGEIQAGPVVGIIMSPEWTAIRTAILQALEPHPDARQAVLHALDQLPASTPPTVTRAIHRGEAPHGDMTGPVRLADRLQGGEEP